METGESAASRGRAGLLKIPRQPPLRGFRHGGGVLLEGHQVVERVDPIKLTGVDEAHVDVADSGPVQRFKARGVFPVKDRHLERNVAKLRSSKVSGAGTFRSILH